MPAFGGAPSIVTYGTISPGGKTKARQVERVRGLGVIGHPARVFREIHHSQRVIHQLILDQTTVQADVIPRQGNTRPLKASPDICVHTTQTNASRISLILAVDGPPALAIEFASPSTALTNDTNLVDSEGKPSVYWAIGIREYLVFDPTGDILGAHV